MSEFTTKRLIASVSPDSVSGCLMLLMLKMAIRQTRPPLTMGSLMSRDVTVLRKRKKAMLRIQESRFAAAG